MRCTVNWSSQRKTNVYENGRFIVPAQPICAAHVWGSKPSRMHLVCSACAALHTWTLHSPGNPRQKCASTGHLDRMDLHWPQSLWSEQHRCYRNKGISNICIPKPRIFRYLCITASPPALDFHLLLVQYHLLSVELL